MPLDNECISADQFKALATQGEFVEEGAGIPNNGAQVVTTQEFVDSVMDDGDPSPNQATELISYGDMKLNRVLNPEFPVNFPADGATLNVKHREYGLALNGTWTLLDVNSTITLVSSTLTPSSEYTAVSSQNTLTFNFRPAWHVPIGTYSFTFEVTNTITTISRTINVSVDSGFAGLFGDGTYGVWLPAEDLGMNYNFVGCGGFGHYMAYGAGQSGASQGIAFDVDGNSWDNIAEILSYGVTAFPEAGSIGAAMMVKNNVVGLGMVGGRFSAANGGAKICDNTFRFRGSDGGSANYSTPLQLMGAGVATASDTLTANVGIYVCGGFYPHDINGGGYIPAYSPHLPSENWFISAVTGAVTAKASLQAGHEPGMFVKGSFIGGQHIVWAGGADNINLADYTQYSVNSRCRTYDTVLNTWTQRNNIITGACWWSAVFNQPGGQSATFLGKRGSAGAYTNIGATFSASTWSWTNDNSDYGPSSAGVEVISGGGRDFGASCQFKISAAVSPSGSTEHVLGKWDWTP